MALGSALYVLTTLGLVLVVVPRLLFPRPAWASGPFERLLVDAVRAGALYVMTVLVLTPIRLFQATGIVLWFAIVAILVRRRRLTMARVETALDTGARLCLYLVEAVLPSGNVKIRNDLRRWGSQVVRPKLAAVAHTMHPRKFVYVAPLVVIVLLATAIRLDYSLHHAAYPTADSYVHLAWIKFMLKSRLFTDGIYPMGMHAVLAVAGSIGGANAFELIRFAGALLSGCTVFVIYLISVRVTRNTAAALAATAAAGLVWVRSDVGLDDFRFVATLPQEFAILFALIAVYIGVEYSQAPRRGRAMAFGAAAVIVAATHPVALGLVALAAGGFGLAAAARGGRQATIRLWVASAVGAAVGHSYLLVGFLLGKSIYSPVNPNPVGTGGTTVPDGVVSLIWGHPIRVAAVVGALAATAVAAGTLRRSPRAPATLGLSIVLVTAVAIRTPGDMILGGWYVDRWTDVALAVLPLGIALGLAPLRLLWAKRDLLVRVAGSTAAGTALAVGLVVALPPEALLAERGRIEHEEEARVISEIMRSNERFTYTIVGTPAAFDRVFASGLHVPLIWFANSLDVSHAIDPAFALPIATPKVFVIIEKEAFRFQTRIPVRGATASYYEPRDRAGLMRAVDGWLTNYARSRDGVAVWYEDDVVRVWLVDHEPDFSLAKRYEFVQRLPDDQREQRVAERVAADAATTAADAAQEAAKLAQATGQVTQ